MRHFSPMLVLLSLLAVCASCANADTVNTPDLRRNPDLGSASGWVQLNPQPEPPIWLIRNVDALRAMARRSGKQPFKVTESGKPMFRPSRHNAKVVADPAGASSYSKAKGVVLSIAKPTHPATGSDMSVYLASYDEATRKLIDAGDPGVALSQIVAPPPPPTQDQYGINWHAALGLPPFVTGAQAQFRNLPAGMHTYVLTVGTTAPKQNLVVVLQVLDDHQDDLQMNPATSEASLLFTLQSKAGDSVWVSVGYTVPEDDKSWHQYSFHHIQLVRID